MDCKNLNPMASSAFSSVGVAQCSFLWSVFFLIIVCALSCPLSHCIVCPCIYGTVAVVIVWYLDLQLPVQSVPITTNGYEFNPAQARCTRSKLCDKVCQWLATGQWFYPGTPVSSINKTDRHDITELLLKEALSIINQTKPILYLRILIIRLVSSNFSLPTLLIAFQDNGSTF